MIANPTTLILGAGASFPVGYPIGSGLRRLIIDGKGSHLYLEVLHRLEAVGQGAIERVSYQKLKGRFKRSYVLSIDAFLAEPENLEFREAGCSAIAAALLPCEQVDRDWDWYEDLFDAIRFRHDEKRRHKLKVVTFNYDLSLEFFLFHAFESTYGLSPEAARALLNDNIEIIHVYGSLGELEELSDHEDARQYGKSPTGGEILKAGKGIHVIGRHEERGEAFRNAFSAISEATFVGILGYGFDRTNNENLNLQKAIADKFPFATGFGLGCGARARLTSLAGNGRMIVGGKSEGVKTFLAETDFLQWINEPGATPNDLASGIKDVFASHVLLPYQR